MEDQILTSNYVFDIQKKIWSRSDYVGISYSDGDETELRIARIIDQASDLTVFSTELRQHCIDWPTFYHLFSARANILRPFETSLTGDVLEIGAGCGAITRYLGECGANVLALEGSPRRAAIARSRTRNLDNVTVLAEKFDQFQCDHRFDVITLIGVLEYANLFTNNGNPALAMLQRVRTLLKPEGRLILAIENQLGLKYFAGAPEDHLGRPMYGIEGRYRTDEPQTFGRAALADLLTEAGFAHAEFLAPFPDYKLPVSILTQEGLANKRFDGAALAWQSVRRDPQLPPSPNFSLELAWSEVFANGLALDMANSFLVVTSPLLRQVVERGVLGYHYSTDRIPQFCKETVFKHIDKNTIVVNYHMLGDSRQYDDGENRIIKFSCPTRATYVEGIPLSLEFIKIVTRDGWSIEEVGAFIQRYINFLLLIADQKGNFIGTSELADKLPGDFFDMAPQNIIISPNGQPIAIDTEWALNGEIELGWLLFRSLLLAIGSVVGFGENSTRRTFTRGDFVKSALDASGFSFTDEDFRRFIELESIVQQEVTGRASQQFVDWQPEQLLPIHVLVKRDHRIDLLHDEIDMLRTELDMRRNEINALCNSTSWKVTAPLRSMRSFTVRLIDKPRTLNTCFTAVQRGTECYQAKILSTPQAARHRVVHVIANFLTGGSSRLIVDLFEHLGHLYEQEVVTQYNPDPPNYAGIPIYELAGGRTQEKFIDYLRQYQPELIHIHYWEDRRWYGMMINAAHEFGCKVIENINTPTAPYIDNCISRYIYVSDYVKNTFGKQDRSNLTIYPGSNFNLFSRNGSQATPDDCIGMVYRLDIDKLNKRSIDVFIKVVQKRPQTKVIIVGGGPYLEPYKATVKAHKVENAFNFTGFVPYEKLPEFYAQMSLFVAPVWKESFGQVSPFAMSMGIPVVGYNVGALGEILGDGRLLVTHGNSDELAEMIVGLLDDKERRERISHRNRERAHKLFSIENMICSYTNLYRELIGEKR